MDVQREALASLIDNYIALRDSLLSLASDRTVRVEVSSKVSGFASLMAEFTFLYGVSLALHLLRMTTPVVRAIQGPKQAASATLTLVKELTETVAGQPQRHEFWERTTADASRLEVEEPKKELEVWLRAVETTCMSTRVNTGSS